MRSQTTLSKSRDRDGAGTLNATELTVALDYSGVSLSARMTVEQIAAAVAVGVAKLGRDNIRVRSAWALRLNRAMCSGEWLGAFLVPDCEQPWTSMRRHVRANDLAWRMTWAMQDAANELVTAA